MARTTIIAQAQNADNLTTPGYITPDNISTDLVQLRLSGDDEIFSLGTIYTAYQWIIKGDGVNGEVVGSYPPTDTDPELLSLFVGYNWPQGNVSEIFTYLNAGGPNVKYTKFTYNAKRYNTTSFINPNTRGQGIEWDRNLQNDISVEVEIYWGKYTKFGLSTLDGVISNYFFDISELSGKTNAAARSLSFSPSANENFQHYPEIDLDTRKITKLPRYFLDGSANGHKLCDHFWKIETDDFATTVTAPTPQETTEEVSGTKISQLSSTTTLQDDDLLVISRDEGSDGSFDTSYNTSLSNLAAKINEGMNEEGGQLPRFVPLNLPLLTSSITASDPNLEPIITAQLVYNEGQKAYVNQFFGFGSENVVTNTSTISVHKIVFLDLVGIIPPEAKYIQCKLDDVQTGTDIEWVVESESIGEIYTTSSGTRFASPGIEYRLTRGNSGRVTNYVNRFAIERGLDSFIVQDPNNVNGSGPTLQPDRLNYQPYTDIIVRRNSAYRNSLTSVTLHPLTIEGYYI